MLPHIRFACGWNHRLFLAKIVIIDLILFFIIFIRFGNLTNREFCNICKSNCKIIQIFYSVNSSVSPRHVMMMGVSAQVIFGNLIGVVRVYEFHVLFRWLTAASCALMYTSGSMICMFTFWNKRIVIYIFF